MFSLKTLSDWKYVPLVPFFWTISWKQFSLWVSHQHRFHRPATDGIFTISAIKKENFFFVELWIHIWLVGHFFYFYSRTMGMKKRVSFLPSIWRLTDRNPCGFSIYTCPDVKDWLIIKNNFLSEVLIGWSVLVVRQVLVGEISGFLAYNYETCRLISAIHKLQPNEDAARIANKLLDSNFVELFGIILKGQTCLPRRDSRRRRKSFWNLRIRPGVSEVFSRDG